MFQRHCTHLAIIPRNVRISHYLRKHRAQRRRAECVVASAGKLELLTQEHKERGGLLGRSESEGLCELKGTGAECARVVRDGSVSGQ
jgi:hypothetical protein